MNYGILLIVELLHKKFDVAVFLCPHCFLAFVAEKYSWHGIPFQI